MAFEEENKPGSHLQELSGSDYQIVEGEPDITGWSVIDAQGRKIGDVEDVLFDTQSRDVRYIIVDLEDNELDIELDKKVLVPIGIAELHDQYNDDTEEDNSITEIDTAEDAADEEDDEIYDDEVVYLPSVTIEQLMALPAYDKDDLSPERESSIRNIFERPAAGTTLYEKESFYSHEHFNNKIYPRNDTPYTGDQGSQDHGRNTGTDSDRTIL